MRLARIKTIHACRARRKNTFFPRKIRGFVACTGPEIFRFTAQRGANGETNESGPADRKAVRRTDHGCHGCPERRLDLIGRCHNMPA